MQLNVLAQPDRLNSEKDVAVDGWLDFVEVAKHRTPAQIALRSLRSTGLKKQRGLWGLRNVAPS